MTGLVLGYDGEDVERFWPEPGRSQRPTFERDRARIVHSAALRRLAAKTQVVGPSSHDFIRNRLTHTLEVAQVGRDLAHSLGCQPDVVEAACLAHDLGHPPFGHNGEGALDHAAADIGGFEGNAQTFRLLTRLEAKTMTADGRSLGLNLTRTVLDAATKYPWPRESAVPARDRHGDGLVRAVPKFGVYADDRELFDWMRAPAPDRGVCLEAQIMDVADDVAYSVHDVEDGIVAGRVDLLRVTADHGLRADVLATVRNWYLPQAERDRLEAAFGRLAQLDSWPTTAYDGSRAHLAALKNLTSELIGRFCATVRTAARSWETSTSADATEELLSRYAADIVVPDEIVEEIALLKGIAAHLVMQADDRVAAHARQRELLAELVDAVWLRAPGALEPIFRADFGAAPDDLARRRVVVDQVASWTDSSAVDAHRRLVRTA